MKILATMFTGRSAVASIMLVTGLLLIACTSPVSGALYLNEILFNPPGSQDDPNEFVELRGTPNATIAANAYLVSIDGDSGNAGKVRNIFPLGGMTIGTNGFLVLLQKGHPYTVPAGANAAVNTGSGGGWGDGDSSSIGHKGHSDRTNIVNAPVTLMLVESTEAPKRSDHIDGNDDGMIDGIATNWVILDAVGILDNSGSPAKVYGKINFRRDASPGNTAYATNTVVEVGFTGNYVARNGNSTGWETNDWVLSESLIGSAPNYTLPTSDVYPLDFAGSSVTPGRVNKTPPLTTLPKAWSGVVNDPNNPSIGFTVSTDSPATNITVTVQSGSSSNLPNSQISLSGSGGTWTLAINPTNACYDVPIYVTVSDGTAQTVRTIRYAASLGWKPETHFHLGFGDASAAIPLDDDYMLVADDETHPIRLVSRKQSGAVIREFDFHTALGVTNRYPETGSLYEADFEAATRSGNVIYWLSSHGNGADGRKLANRNVLFATQISGSGSNVSLTLIGHYNFLRSDLINWDSLGQHRKGEFYYGLLDSTADLHVPKTIDGFNIEGFTMALGEANTNVALIAFRAPLVPITQRQKALLLPVTNLTSLVSGVTNFGAAKFGVPIELDLGGRGIRSIERFDSGYLILAGPWGNPTGDSYEFRLFVWSGDPNHAPQEMSADFSGLNPEGIVGLSSGTLSSTSQVQVVSDNGTARWYSPLSNKETKDLPEANFRKCRSDWVTVGNPVSSQSTWSENAEAAYGRFVRGTGTNSSSQSYVASLDGLKGVRLADQGSEFYPGNDWTNTLYHHNAANPASPIAFQNPIAAFGTDAGGTPLTPNRTYTFRTGFGDRPRSTVETNNTGFEIAVYDRHTFQRVTNVMIPLALDPWFQVADFSREGIIVELPQFGLSTRIRPGFNEVMDIEGFYISHRAAKTDYLFVVSGLGYIPSTNAPPRSSMVSNSVAAALSPLYVISFDRSPAWRSDFVLQPHFEGEPLPPDYAGKTVTELLHYSAPLTNQISLAGSPGSYTNLDTSPELRRHPILDEFVSDLNRDPVALANYVQNEIQLTDAFTYSEEGNSETSVNQGGMNRGALATFMEGQGSPLEQCSLLVYLLRQSGVPAVYVFPSRNGLKLLDARLSRLLRCQLRSPTNSEPRLIPVNYPWVAAYDGTNWMHLFPWLKDTELQEGLNLYEYLPEGFNNGYKWALEYLRVNDEIFQLGMAKDTPAELFPSFVQQQLYTRFPGITLADIGVKIQDRKRQSSRWQDFPKPTLVTNEVFAVESMGVITNTIPTLTNVFNTLSVEVYSVTNPAKKILTGDLRVLDLHNRKFTLWYQPTNFDHQIILTLDSLRPSATNQYSFATADTMSPTNSRIAHIISATNVLGATDDTLTMKFNLTRHPSLSFLPNSLNPLLPVSARQIVTPKTENQMERIIRKGDLISICVNPGRISPKMFAWQQERYNAIDTKAKTNSAFRAQLTAEAYEGQIIHLLGTYYFTGVDRFSKICQQLHKVETVSWFSLGLAKMGAKRNTSDVLPAGNVAFNKAILDIFFQELSTVGNGSIHPNREVDSVSANDSFSTLLMLNSAAQEHAALDRFFGRTNAISTVTLLQKSTLMKSLTSGLNFGVIELTKENYLAQGERQFNVDDNIIKLKEFDPLIWQTITNTFALEGVSNSLRAIVTPGFVTNAVGSHFGALLFGGKYFASLLSPYSINGGVASLGEDCGPESKSGNLWLGNDCNYHFEAWFGDHLYQGDRVVGCANAPAGTPTTITVCCEDLGICDNPESDMETLSISISAALAAQAQYEQRRLAREIGNLQNSIQNNFDFSYKFDLKDPEATGYTPQNYNLTASSGGPRVTDYDDYFTVTPLTQTDFDFKIRSAGFVGTERFVDTRPQSHNHSLVSDPVNALTGEFFSQEEDLRLSGPFPLSLRRNYSSRNMANNDFGFGWNLAFFPYLTVTLDGAKIYAVEPDGSVISYRRQGNSTNWFPDLGDNKEWNNQNVPGQPVSANLMLATLTLETVGTNSYYRVQLPDGSRRTYVGRIFQDGSVERDRPYLTQWADHRGNSHNFFYGEEPGRNDYGQLRRIKSSSGDSLIFRYDDKGHIVEALASDGRRVRYYYDYLGEDLTSVLLPDGSRIQYSYERVLVPTSVSTVYKYVWVEVYLPTDFEARWVPGHFIGSLWIPGEFVWVVIPGRWEYIPTLSATTVTNFGSSHRIVSEVRPEGRALRNVYDSLGRVTEQWATVGLDLRPVKNATFVYSNNWTLNGTNAASGFTLIIDAFGNTNRFDYTNGLITSATDSYGTGIVQEWYAQSGNGGYPRSLKSRTDQRGQKQTFFYDARGNVLTNIISGADLTGDGLTNAVYSFSYDTNNTANTLIRAVSPLGRTVDTVYDAVFTRLPKFVVNYASNGVAIRTNAFFYTNATTVLSYDTNSSFGLLTRTVIAYGSGDAATNDFEFDGRGFLTKHTQYPGTGDPNVVTRYYHNNRGEMVESEDAAGTLRRFAYNERGQPTVAEIYAGEAEVPMAWEYFYYNDNGEITWSDGPRFDPEDYIWRDYDGAGRLTQSIRWRSRAKSDGSGVEAETGDNLYATSFNEYDLFGNHTKATDAIGNYQRMYYDAVGRIVREESYDVAGTLLATNGFAYNAAGDVTNFCNALGGVGQMQYTTGGQLKFVRHPDGSTNAWRYYADGRLRREVQRNGAYWETTYDDVARKTTRVFYSASGTPLATNSMELDRRGNIVKSTDAAGFTFTNAYDGLNRLKISAGPPIVTIGQDCPVVPNCGNWVTNILQQTITNFYDAAGLWLTNINTLGEKAIARFDGLGRPIRSEIRDKNNVLIRETSTGYASDHQSISVTNGSGASALVNTLFSDNDGQPVLSIAYPHANAREFARNTYDMAGNPLIQARLSATNTSLTTWQVVSNSYDGLYRLRTQTALDNAVTIFEHDAAGNVTNRIMPGGALKWQARYNAASQLLEEKNVGSGGAATRTNVYSYYAAGSPFAGLLQTRTDGVGVVSGYHYDDFLRVTNCLHASPVDSDLNIETFWHYDARGLLTYVTESVPHYDNPSVQLWHDAYGQLTSERVEAAYVSSLASQTWDAAGRRTGLTFDSHPNRQSYSFSWRSDGLLASVAIPGGAATYGYNSAGILTNRSVGSRSTIVSALDGMGRPLAITNKVSLISKLSETLTRTGDGLLTAHTVDRAGNFTDSRSYAYADLSRRLVEERLNLDATKRWTNAFAYDNAQSGGPGILTRIGPATGAARWSATADAFSRLNIATNTVVTRSAYGRANGQSTITASLDGQTIPLATANSYLGDWPIQWRASLPLTTGAHQLTVMAAHPSGQFTTNRSVWFTNNIAHESVQENFDAMGRLTYRVWKNPNGTTNRTENLIWDVKGRLWQVIGKDSQNIGSHWYVTYDPFGRKIFTQSWLTTNDTQISSIDFTPSYYDPEVEFLELGTAVLGQHETWKLYGPDLNGVYGGMNGVGGLEGTQTGLGAFLPTISDARGNILGVVTNGLAVSWNPSRPTGYGAPVGYRPLATTTGANVAQASAWRGKRPEPTGYIYLGARFYDLESGSFLSSDPVWNGRDPNYYSFTGGDPINYFDADGRLGKGAGHATWDMIKGVGSLINNTMGALSYHLTAPFAPEWADQTYGYYARQFDQTVFGLGGLVWDTSGALSYAVTSPFAPDFANVNYGPSVERMKQLGTTLTGGAENSGAYRFSYTAVNVGTLFLGGGTGQTGRAGRVGEVTEAVNSVRGAETVTALTIGARVKIRIRASDFTAEQQALIRARYEVANARIGTGAETAKVGNQVDYVRDLSRRYVRDVLKLYPPNTPLSKVRIPKDFNVDEFVSRQFGGRQLPENQNLLPTRINTALGPLEEKAVRSLPDGTTIQGFDIEFY